MEINEHEYEFVTTIYLYEYGYYMHVVRIRRSA